MTKEIILTRGLPASGKTTWAMKFVGDYPEFVNLNRDDVRLMLQGEGGYGKFRKWRETLVTDIVEQAAKSALDAGKSLVISDTNLNPNVVEKWRVLAAERGAEFFLNDDFLEVPVGVCIERDNARKALGERHVGQSVITSMFNKYRDLWVEKGLIYRPDATLPGAYVFDIDGTIAKMNGRSPYDYTKVDTDVINAGVVNVKRLIKNSGNKIILLSGRDGSCREATENWLHQQWIEYDELHMRPAGNSENDAIIKRRMFFEHVAPKYHVLGVFDDRDRVVHMWRGLGIPTFQVDYGSF